MPRLGPFSLLLSGALLADGCGDHSGTTAPPPPRPVASVAVSPETLALTPGQVGALTADVRDASGAPLTDRAVGWLSSDWVVASVSEQGLVTGIAAGSATVSASAGGKSGSAEVTVAPPLAATIALAPPTLSLRPDEGGQFFAEARSASGTAIPGKSFTWMSSDPVIATVSPTGQVAAVTVGVTTISATVDGQVGSASVTVASGPAPTLLFNETFEDASFASRGWYDLLPNAVSAAEHIPASTGSLEARFNQGATNTSPGIGMRHKFTPSESVYLSYWVKYSSNWVGSGQNFHPHEFYLMTTENPNDYQGPAFTRLTTMVEQNYQNGLGGLRAVVSAQDGENIDQGQWNVDLSNSTENRAVSGCNGPAGSTRDGTPNPDCYLNGSVRWNGKSWRTAQAVFTNAAGPGYKNDWHKVEAYFKLNSIVNGKAQLDGVVRYWFDGLLVIDRTNVELRTGARPNMKFDKFSFSPYIGNGSPVAQSMWVDDLVVMDRRP